MQKNVCYAAGAGGCSEKMSGEHVVSSAILGKTVTVRGLSWCKDKDVSIGTASFKRKNLCDAHNTQLSKYDVEAEKYISAVNAFNLRSKLFQKQGHRPGAPLMVHEVDGPRLEKWCCKTLINTAMSQEPEPYINLQPLLPVLFDQEDLQPPYGLYAAVRLGEKIDTSQFLQILPLLPKKEGQTELAGGLFVFRGFKMVLLLPGSSVSLKNPNGKLMLDPLAGEEWMGLQLNWHNSAIQEGNPAGGILQEVRFSWPPHLRHPLSLATPH